MYFYIAAFASKHIFTDTFIHLYIPQNSNVIVQCMATSKEQWKQQAWFKFQLDSLHMLHINVPGKNMKVFLFPLSTEQQQGRLDTIALFDNQSNGMTLN